MKDKKEEITPEMKKQISVNRWLIGSIIVLLVGVPLILTLIMGIRVAYVYNKTINGLENTEAAGIVVEE